MAQESRGEQLTRPQALELMWGCEDAIALVKYAMREQSNKDKVLGYLHTEYQELKEIADALR